MIQLVIFNLVLIAIIIFFTIITKKKCTNKRRMMIIASFITVGVHYSSLLYHFILEGWSGFTGYLTSNPNLLLPIYPCNVVMWGLVWFAFVKDEAKLKQILADFMFLFGIVSCLGGMFANVDFIRDPNFLNYDVTKGIVAHGAMFYNVLLLSALGYYKFDVKDNIHHIAIGVVAMFIIGCYCNLVILALSSADYAYSVNSMFIIHSPFDDGKLLTYPFIALCSVIGYYIILKTIYFIKKARKN